jgi:hypothetical protein
MGEWTHIEGTHNSKRVSMKKLVDLIWGGEDIVFDKQENGQSFCFRAETSGMNAAKHLDLICKEFKRLDKNARLHMSATIDFYA